MNFITPFKWLIQLFYNLTQNWGWAVILLTLFFKVILFPTSIKQFRSLEKMKKVQPKIKEIQDKYKDKPEELQRRMMELYKKENVNPFGSCLPMILQLLLLWPIFYLLSDPKHGILTDAFRNTQFLWFKLGDQGIPLTNGVLAVISGLTTFLQTKLTTPSTSGEQNQQQIFLYIMPVFIGFITYSVNAGMALYWIISNILGIIQQYLINEYFIVKEHIKKEDEIDEKEAKEIKDARNLKEEKEEQDIKDVKELRIEDLRGKRTTTNTSSKAKNK
ncbi:MAG: YidC/Oxa1 family membrane protein insertase [Firmicutes bacterium]|nr:YidC/Oxa1 family membrane protein insertase [Bacillota bacterium]